MNQTLDKYGPEDELQETIAKFSNDPYGFVMFSYPWGEPGPLKDETGPDIWQERVLKDIGHGLQHGFIDNHGVKIDTETGIFIAVRSGHGIGKSALMSMLDHWFMSTRPNPQIVTTANTKEQLGSKTWREMAKWHKLLINRHWFTLTATTFSCLADPATWFSKAIPWSENNPEAFAGTHERHVMFKFDEASAIPNNIWETSEGAMTEVAGVKIWIVFGNPTKSTGRFSECFGKRRGRWVTYEVDSRDSKRTDKKLLQVWIDEYGEDSDFVRVRVKGQEPRVGALQLISKEAVESAYGKILHPSSYEHAPKILGVDVARFGDDFTCFIKRQGLAAYDLKKYSGIDTMHTASLVIQEINDWNPDAVFIDVGGLGAGVVDRIRQLGYVVTEVNFGSKATDEKRYAQKRSEMWVKLRDWLLALGCAIPEDVQLRDDLLGPEYGFDARERIQLERKVDMKKRGLASPDCGDALALTFAENVIKLDDIRMMPDMSRLSDRLSVTDYDVLEYSG